ncbi:MAG: hypothetical protein QOH87_939 [Trebonia sp.]|nr:hypothetical protein [Trebonia sp.]
MFRLFHRGVNARSGRHVPDDLRRTRHSGPEPTEPWGLAESWIEDPAGIRIVLVEFPPATLSAVTTIGVTAQVTTAMRHVRAFTVGFKRIDRPILGYPRILSALARMTRMS